jgi:hypothetical protein
MGRIMHTRILMAAACFALLGACASAPAARTREEAIAHIGDAQHVVVGLKNGGAADIFIPRDFGDAVCGAGGCVRKADIVSIRNVPGRPANPAGDALGVLAMPVLLPVAVGATLACAVADCKSQAPAHASVDAPPATPQQRSRAWVDGVQISGGAVTGQAPNPCFAAPGAPSPESFETQAAALDWVWTHHRDLGPACLSGAAAELQHADISGGETRLRAFALWAYVRVRGGWTREHCWSPEGPDTSAWRVVPPIPFDIGLRRGDPALLAVVDAVFDDPAAQDWRSWSPAMCRLGLRLESEWPDRALWETKHRPMIPGA